MYFFSTANVQIIPSTISVPEITDGERFFRRMSAITADTWQPVTFWMTRHSSRSERCERHRWLYRSTVLGRSSPDWTRESCSAKNSSFTCPTVRRDGAANSPLSLRVLRAAHSLRAAVSDVA